MGLHRFRWFPPLHPASFTHLTMLLKVVYLLPNLRRGGTERRVVRLVNHGEWSSEVHLMFSTGAPGENDPDLLHALEQAGVKVRHLGLRGFRHPLRWWPTLQAVRRWRDAIREAAPDLVHAFLPSANILALMATPHTGEVTGRRDLPRIILSQSALGRYRRRQPMLGTLERMLYPRAAMIVCNSEAVRADLLLSIPRIRPSHAEVVYNGVEFRPSATPWSTPLERAEWRARHAGVEPGEALLLMVANLIPYKGHDLAIQSLAFLPPTCRVRLVLVGGDPQGWQAHLERIALIHGVADRVAFVGPVADPQPWYGAADLLLAPSHEEGFSNTIVEAMAARLPVVATRVGGTPEALGEEFPGLLQEYPTPEVFAGVVAQLLAKPSELEALGLELEQRFREQFTLAHMGTAMLNIYQEVMAR